MSHGLEEAAHHFELACRLERLGSIDEAKRAYLEVLRCDPQHFGAINNLGSMLFRRGFARDAAVLYAQAVKLHPDNPMGYINLGNAYFALAEYEAAREVYLVALTFAPDDQTAHHGLGNSYSRLGDEAAANSHFARAFAHRPSLVTTHVGAEARLRVLTLFDASTGNLDTRHFLADPDIAETKIAAGFFEPGTPLPPHDIVLNAIGDADRCAAALERAIAIVASTNAPVINRPERVLATRRIDIARYGDLAGTVVPRVAEFDRATLRGPSGAAALTEAGFAFPLLLRAPGYHTGEHFVRIDSAGALAEEAAHMPGDSLIAIEFADTRGRDGAYRKYRVIIAGERLYPLHLAISTAWKVHYFSADMAENESNRAEDAAFLDDMAAAIGPRAISALEGVRARLALEYAGIDFGLDSAGNVVLFEANATMIVPEPPPDPRWDYRRPHVAQIVAAIGDLLAMERRP